MGIRTKLHIIFENPTKHKYGKLVQFLIFTNIFVSIVIMFLQTEKSLEEYYPLFDQINFVNVMIFTLEYILRIYSISHLPKRRVFAHMSKPMMIIDLLAILPFYLSLFDVHFGFLRALRVLRIFKLFRLAKFAQFDRILISIIKEKKEEFLFITIALFVMLMTIAPLVYHCEKDAQPEIFASMLDTMWWAIITFTTVGYGDMYPVTTTGRILTTIVSFLGIAFYAIPGSIFTSALLDKINERKRRDEKC